MFKNFLSQMFWTQLALSTVSLTSIFAVPVLAQIAPDSSLGDENSIVTPNATVQDALADLIEGGAIRGNNLFHSFSEFNVSKGGNVYFANPDGIANILTRVTGNNLSEIFGTLGVEGAANLFLLNPNGIVFGENAALDVNGSFLATTADSYVFENEFAYSASNAEMPPLLAINLPVGVQFGVAAQPIINRSRTVDTSDFPQGLQVLSENNITFVGGDLLLEGGYLTAPSGSIELASVTPNSLVEMVSRGDNWTLNYSQVNNFQDIKLTQGGSINSSGNGAGDINLQGKKIQLLDGSDIFANNFGEKVSGKVRIEASELLELIGGNVEGQYLALLEASVFGTGKGGGMEIATKVLRIVNGGQIASGTFDLGDSGNLSIEANKIEIIGTSVNGFPSGIFTSVQSPDATGKGGELSINTDNLLLKDNSMIISGTNGTGDGGILSIEANNLELSGSLISSQASGKGNAGDINIDVEKLELKDDAAQISTLTFGSGNAGNLNISASESIKISGTGIFPDFQGNFQLFSSGLLASVEPGATGNGGNITVTTDQLEIFAGGKIAAGTLGEGNAGDIFIQANNLEVQNTVIDNFGTRSGITSTVELQGVGNGGNLEIVTNNLNLIDGGLIAADSLGEGNAGNINIQAENINISGVSSGEPVRDFEQESLPSQISAFSQGDFDAGSITINSKNLNLSNQGNISVSNLSNGNSGNLNITANQLNLDRSATIEAKVNAGDQGDINLTTDKINLNNQSQITVEATGTATGGNINIDNSNLILVRNNSDIRANAVFGSGGNISISTELIFTDSTSGIDASSEFGLDGVVEIKSPESQKELSEVILPGKIEDPTSLIVVACPSSGGNSLAVTGNGGVPNSPYHTQSLNTTWYDLRPVKQKKAPVASLPTPSTPLTEATATMIDANGELELVALTPLSTHRWIKSSCSSQK